MPALSGQKVLVVEDEAIIAMMIEMALLDEGAEIIGPAFRCSRPWLCSNNTHQTLQPWI